jgi:hypothetical protein
VERKDTMPIIAETAMYQEIEGKYLQQDNISNSKLMTDTAEDKKGESLVVAMIRVILCITQQYYLALPQGTNLFAIDCAHENHACLFRDHHGPRLWSPCVLFSRIR